MTTETSTDSALAAASEALGRDDPDWLAGRRADAFARFEASPLPDRVQHLWRYTDPAKLMPGRRELHAPAETFGELPADCHDGTFENVAGLALERDGRVLRTVADPAVLDRGVLLEDLRSAAREREDLVGPRLFSLSNAADSPGDRFEALSGALFAGGTLVEVPRGVVLDRPLRVARRVGGDGLFAGRSLVVARENSEATIVFDLGSDGADDAALLHETTEVFVEQNARLRIVYLQGFGRRVVHAPTVHCRVDRDARFESVTVALGGAVTKSYLGTSLVGPGSSAHVLGIVFGSGRQHFDHHTLQKHLVGHTTSDLDYRTVVADRARTAYTGNLRIGLEGVGAEAHQRNHNLLLSDTARADTIPELEILTNDVQCSHAAAVGPIDPEQIYFCMSRGLTEETARKAIVLGFLEPVVARVPGDALKGRVRDALEARLRAAN